MPRRIAITIATLGAVVFIALTGVLYNESVDGRPWLVGAIVAMLAAAMISLALLISTNTCAEPQTWGRRVEDKGLIETISDAMEREAAKRPYPARTPDWAGDLDETTKGKGA